jgi:DNA-nicking Smr family endonuclease
MARRLGEQEKALWGRVIATVKPMHVAKPKAEAKPPALAPKAVRPPAKAGALAAKAHPVAPKLPPVQEHKTPNNLDGHWDRRIHKGGVVPDVSVDLHGSALSGAYARLDGALEQAIAQRMKVILLVTGKARTHDRASGEGRGAIASVVRDWLAASRHASNISAVRNAHPRHGGSGALYIILKS